MAIDEHQAWAEGLRDELRATFRCAYGRDWEPAARRMTTSLRGAGYGTTGGWWSLAAALDRAGTTFAAERQLARLDAMLADLLLWPEEAADRQWAERYGFGSASAAGRAFRRRYQLSVGEARRLGRLAAWLVGTQRQPRAAKGIARRTEAADRLRSAQRLLSAQLEPRGRRALALLISGEWPHEQAERPRHPATVVVALRAAEATEFRRSS